MLENCVSEVPRQLRLYQHVQEMASPLPCWMPPWGGDDTNQFSSLGQSSWRCCLFSIPPVRGLCPGSFNIPPGGKIWGLLCFPWKRFCIPPGLRPQQETAPLFWDLLFLHNAKTQIWSHLALSNTHWVIAVRNKFMNLNQGTKTFLFLISSVFFSFLGKDEPSISISLPICFYSTITLKLLTNFHHLEETELDSDLFCWACHLANLWVHIKGPKNQHTHSASSAAAGISSFSGQFLERNRSWRSCKVGGMYRHGTELQEPLHHLKKRPVMEYLSSCKDEDANQGLEDWGCFWVHRKPGLTTAADQGASCF